MMISGPADTLLVTCASLGKIRTDWTSAEVAALFAAPFTDLLFMAQQAWERRFQIEPLAAV